MTQPAAKTWDHGQATIGTSASQVIAAATAAIFGISFKAAPDNAGIVYIGRSDVTADTANATDGIPLAAGEEFFIPTDNPSTVYAIASQASQGLFFAYA